MATAFKTCVPFTKDRIKESDRLVTGWVSRVWPDEIGDVMMPDGADCSYLDKHKSVNLYHDQRRPIGSHRWHEVKSDGILVQFKVGKHAEGEEAWTMIQEGVLGTLSIEYEGDHFGPPTGDEVKKYGEKARRVYRKWKLRGYAVVSQPCNADAVIIESKGRVDEWLLRRVKDGKCSLETAVRMGLAVEPAAERRLIGPSGVWTWKVPA